MFRTGCQQGELFKFVFYGLPQVICFLGRVMLLVVTNCANTMQHCFIHGSEVALSFYQIVRT